MRAIAAIILMIAVYQGLKYLWGKRELSYIDKPNKYFFYGSIAVGVAAYFLVIQYGVKVPGSFFERSEYETMLYIRLYPDNNPVKSYKVPAEISKVIAEDCYPGSEGQTECSSWSEYRINYAIMPNGGRIVFDEDPAYSIVELNRIISLFDVYEREWGVELTKDPVIVK
jgi:hypothetical protein